MPASAGWSGAAYLTQPVSRIWLHLPADGMDCCCRRRCVSQTQSLRSWLLSVRILCYYFICWTLCLAATVLGWPWLWPGCRVHPHLVDATVSTASCVAASSTISLFLRFCRSTPVMCGSAWVWCHGHWLCFPLWSLCRAGGTHQCGCIVRVDRDDQSFVFCSYHRPCKVSGHATSLSGRVLPEATAGCVAGVAGVVAAAVVFVCVFALLL